MTAHATEFAAARGTIVSAVPSPPSASGRGAIPTPAAPPAMRWRPPRSAGAVRLPLKEAQARTIFNIRDPR
jgi:hypothetical protein